MGAAIEAAQALLYGVVNALVIAGFEMQVVKLFQTAPVASVKTRLVIQKQRACNGFSVATGTHQQAVFRKGASQLVEKPPFQITTVATALEVGELVELVKPVPIRRGDLLAALVFKLKSLLRHLAPLPQDVFALARAHGAQKIVEITITPVVPVELTAQTLGCRQGN